MTKFFINSFKKQNKCTRCSSLPISARKLCPKHLAYARKRWIIFAAERKELGLCLHCNRKGYRGECRCSVHKKENQIKCRNWMAAHPECNKLGWNKCKAILDAGLCLCKGHPPLPAGQKRCDNCRVRSQKYCRAGRQKAKSKKRPK